MNEKISANTEFVTEYVNHFDESQRIVIEPWLYEVWVGAGQTLQIHTESETEELVSGESTTIWQDDYALSICPPGRRGGSWRLLNVGENPQSDLSGKGLLNMLILKEPPKRPKKS